jgi:hypothetical protein
VRSGVTQKVNVNEGIKLSIHAAFIEALSGQLRFLGSTQLQPTRHENSHNLVAKSIVG